MTNQTQCPCGSGTPYINCCGLFIDDKKIPTEPELLMRSRYTAFVQANRDYLLQTWHPTTRPEKFQLEKDTHWLGLTIVDSPAPTASDREAWVEFKAKFCRENREQALSERSRFIQQDGRWFYVDGEYDRQPQSNKIGRNHPCPCGSGKKYKRCCA